MYGYIYYSKQPHKSSLYRVVKEYGNLVVVLFFSTVLIFIIHEVVYCARWVTATRMHKRNKNLEKDALTLKNGSIGPNIFLIIHRFTMNKVNNQGNRQPLLNFSSLSFVAVFYCITE